MQRNQNTIMHEHFDLKLKKLKFYATYKLKG